MTVTMSVGRLGFLFLLVSPGLLQAVRAQALPCPAPSLNNGFLHQEMHPDGEELTYACDTGFKPIVEGWWAKSKCQNGKWSHVPQCIDERSCLPPAVQNGGFPVSRTGWHEDGESVRITCHDGYEITSDYAEATCLDGRWSSLPICGESSSACGEPPPVQHAVVTNVEYRTVFAANAEVEYECEDGYFTQEGGTKKSVTCSSGRWTEGPTCSRGRRPPPGRDDSTTSAGTGSGSQPGHGDSTTSAGGGSDASSDPTGSSGPMITRISACGRGLPVIPNGDVVERAAMYLKYQCQNYYKLVGSETVHCFSDGTWSALPVCQDAFCKVNTALYRDLRPSAPQFMKEGERKTFHCVEQYYIAEATCKDGVVQMSACYYYW
ncbi:complement factor H-like isoform X2 [Salarias fasciatus]|uniref:complement factor H-like isoform X2 n=1 Tax=Salarias fasciatus TaxID=181472 RepID=UPI001176B8D6|nr:complement factor H-like isoform X2 [Salarias fasciatus]